MHIPHAATLPPDTLSSANVARLMVVDDAIDLMATLKKMRPETEYEAVGFTSGKAALAALQEREFDLCLVNLMLPDMDGIALLTAAQAIDPHMIGIIMTGQGDVETAVEAMKAGAYDYVVKPLKWQTLMQTLSRALDVRRLQEERQLQREALHQSEKLSAMSVLLAGVAHELNNPLSVVLGQTSLLSQLATDGPLAVRVEKINQAAERCTHIVKNFLTLARQHPPERHKVCLNQIIREAVELLASPLRVDNVEVAFDLSDAIPTLWADPHQLQQVVINLISNAHQALCETPTPRRITVRTQFDPLRARVSLTVADTGQGVPLALQRHIFEPFFTTKSLGQGTGLGLSICRGIVENHDGSMWVESQPGQGAVFHVELPVQAPHMDVPMAPVTYSPASIRGRAILVVDDEPEVADVLAEMLALDGHEVETAANGVIALDRLRERDYDLILSDFRMPELDGPGLYKALEYSHPDLLHRMVFVTGDTLSPESRTFLEQTRASAISKPFTLEGLRQMVQ